MDEWIPVYSKLLGIVLILKPSQISSSLLCLFNMSLSFFVVFFFNTFLLSGLSVPDLPCIFPAPAVESAIFSQGILIPLNGK